MTKTYKEYNYPLLGCLARRLAVCPVESQFGKLYNSNMKILYNVT